MKNKQNNLAVAICKHLGQWVRVLNSMHGCRFLARWGALTGGSVSTENITNKELCGAC